jgi:hypothetical protein
MTPLDRIRRLCEQATPGDWGEDDGVYMTGVLEELFDSRNLSAADAAFIIEAPQLLPLLLDVYEAARTAIGDADACDACEGIDHLEEVGYRLSAVDAYAAEHLPEAGE